METHTSRYLKSISVIKSYDVPAIKHAREIIEKNITDHWSLEILAAKVGINNFKLKVGFKQLYNDTPYQFLIKLRLEKASRLLLDTDLSIKEVADRIGFDSYRGFSKAFKNNYGVLPTMYRKTRERYCHRYLEFASIL